MPVKTAADIHLGSFFEYCKKSVAFVPRVVV